MKVEDGALLMERVAVKRRWAKYFECLLNIDENEKLKMLS